MTRDGNMFISLNKGKEGILTFGNDNSAKILAKGTTSLGSKHALEINVLLTENMKHNILSVSLMSNQGHILIFNSK